MKKSRVNAVNDQIEKLRNSKLEGLLPNLADRVKAGHLIDVLEGNQPIKVPKNACPKSFQKSGKDNVCFSGADVVSLFPSLHGV